MKEQRKAEPTPFLHLESGWLPLQNLEPRPCNRKKAEESFGKSGKLSEQEKGRL